MLEPPSHGCLLTQHLSLGTHNRAAWGSGDRAGDQEIIGKDAGPQVRQARLTRASLPDRKRLPSMRIANVPALSQRYGAIPVSRKPQHKGLAETWDKIAPWPERWVLGQGALVDEHACTRTCTGCGDGRHCPDDGGPT